MELMIILYTWEFYTFVTLVLIDKVMVIDAKFYGNLHAFPYKYKNGLSPPT